MTEDIFAKWDSEPPALQALDATIKVLNETCKERDSWKSRALALERAAKKHKPGDGAFSCVTCNINLNGKTDGRCRKCGHARDNWQFDEKQFGGGESE
ncbi:MAG: hypothetical protein FWD23_12250 [Oscillospiraceae bacterium]|nr:hypothetical protein [Oscillospiraceae bacterium]